MMVLICCLTQRHDIFKELLYVNLWMDCLTVSHHFFIPGDHWFSASGDIKYLTCHMTLKSHVIEGSCKLMNGNFLWYITTCQVWLP